MSRYDLVKLKQQLEMAIESDTPETQAILEKGLAEALKQMKREHQVGDVNEDDLERVLQIIEDLWLSGSEPADRLPGTEDHQARLSRLLSDIMAVQSFALSVSRGDPVSVA